MNTAPYTPYLVHISVKGIIFEGDRIWLRKNERHEWELPGGKLDIGEQPTETVICEMYEELGFKVTVEKLIDAHLYTITTSSDESKGVLVLSYVCTIVEKSGTFELEGEAGPTEFSTFAHSEIATLGMPDFYKRAIHTAFSLITSTTP